MSRLDDRLRKSLRNLAADILPDPDDLATVHERAVRARRRERWAVPLGALAVAGVVAVVIVVLSYATRPWPDGTGRAQRRAPLSLPVARYGSRPTRSSFCAPSKRLR